MDELKTKVYEAIGAASMCWDPRPNSQISESDRAKEIGDALFAAIETELAATREKLAASEKMRELLCDSIEGLTEKLARAEKVVEAAEMLPRFQQYFRERHEYPVLYEAIKAYREMNGE